MAKITVDIAILPSEEIMDLVIELNSKNPISKFNKTDNLPHISLAMGVIDDSEIDMVNEKLKNICEKFKELELEISKLYYTIRPDGNKSYAFKIKITEEIRQLHTMVMKELPLTHDVSIDMFYQGEKVDPITLYWVKNYKDKHKDPNNYDPHISIKSNDEVEYNKTPIKFKASRVVLCHMGNYGTCRTIFGEFKLLS